MVEFSSMGMKKLALLKLIIFWVRARFWLKMPAAYASFGRVILGLMVLQL
jgi:hypothetical protein